MSGNRDEILLESVNTHRARLTAAFLFGHMDERRVVNDNIKRLIGSIVLAAVACAVCVGVSFVIDILAKQETQQQQRLEQQQPLPTPEPEATP
ncbi:MAG: hypothetical protein ACRCSP_09590 [Rhodoglobus sp.]